MRALLRAICAAALCAASAMGCAPSRAQVDYTMSQGIIWPGGGQKARITYLWSLSRISGADESEGGLTGGFQYDPEFAPLPTAEDTLVRPHSVYVDGGDRMYITDPGARRVCIVDLKKMDTFSITEANGLALQYPIGVVADAAGDIFVTDTELRALLVFDKKGDFKRLLGGPFKRPTGLALDEGRQILYVADSWGHVIYKYSTAGAPMGSVGEPGSGPGQLNYPTHIAVDREGALYVSDTLNFRVQVFGPDGAFVRAFGLEGDSFDTFDKIKGIAVDGEGDIYVADTAQGMIKIFNPQGRLLLFFGKPGGNYGEFSIPTGLYMDRTDTLYVADSFNRRIQAFRFLGGK